VKAEFRADQSKNFIWKACDVQQCHIGFQMPRFSGRMEGNKLQMNELDNIPGLSKPSNKRAKFPRLSVATVTRGPISNGSCG
jgi:hypothetical protein